MNGRKARERRRADAQMPPDLKAEMKERIAAVAAQRAERVAVARKEMKAALLNERRAFDKARSEADVEYESRRDSIVAEFNRRATAAAKEAA